MKEYFRVGIGIHFEKRVDYYIKTFFIFVEALINFIKVIFDYIFFCLNNN